MSCYTEPHVNFNNEPDPVSDCPDYNPTPYVIQYPHSGFPDMPIPEDNPLTNEGVQLGRKLFWDPILSADSTLACAGCHAPSAAFSDPNQFSVGVQGIEGHRNSMALFNLGWNPKFLWDGSANSLEEQILNPVPDPIEMHLQWKDAVQRLENSPLYDEAFNQAFGSCIEIDSSYVAKAIAQFLRTMISGTSKFDKAVHGNGSVQLSDEELNGLDRFLNDGLFDGHCQHCHSFNNFFSNFQDLYRNNGLDEVASPYDFEDPGLGGVTGNEEDYGKFKAVSLRNIELTSPYMHDGRFTTLEEVVDFYVNDVKSSPTVDIIMQTDFLPNGLPMDEQGKSDLIAFLKTLTDWDFVNDTSFQSPF